MGIQEYITDLLNNQLREIRFRYREKVVEDIRNRMCSLLAGWEREDYRKTILFVTDEEALFYEPAAKNDVKRFVVATIRNSMLEVAASVNCNQLKMQEPLSDERIKSITSNAIRYFERCKLEALQNEAESMTYTDVYEEAIQKYPLAWAILKKAAAFNEKENVFEKVCDAGVEDIECVSSVKEYKKVICDGYSLEFDDGLKEELNAIISGEKNIFYVDCFKGLSRNFEKILNVLEIILQNGGAFVTCNYFISNGRIEKRKKILRAFHSEKDMFDHLKNLNGISNFFRNVLKGMVQ